MPLQSGRASYFLREFQLQCNERNFACQPLSGPRESRARETTSLRTFELLLTAWAGRIYDLVLGILT